LIALNLGEGEEAAVEGEEGVEEEEEGRGAGTTQPPSTALLSRAP
jgi:hypothetical protein